MKPKPTKHVYLFPTEPDENDVNLLPKEPDEKIAYLLLPELAAYLTELTNALLALAMLDLSSRNGCHFSVLAFIVLWLAHVRGCKFLHGLVCVIHWLPLAFGANDQAPFIQPLCSSFSAELRLGAIEKVPLIGLDQIAFVGLKESSQPARRIQTVPGRL